MRLVVLLGQQLNSIYILFVLKANLTNKNNIFSLGPFPLVEWNPKE